MRTSVIILAVLAAVAAASAQAPFYRILQHDLQRDANGQAFQLRFLTENGISHSDQGTLRASPEGQVLVRQGESEYVDPAGQRHKLTFTADENGYRPILQ